MPEQTKNWGNSDAGSNLCPRCGKPYIYVGDIIGNIEDYVCTCGKEDGIFSGGYVPSDKTFTFEFDDFKIVPTRSKGWECPKCGRVFSPSVSECPYCNSSKKGDYFPYDNSSGGIRVTW